MNSSRWKYIAIAVSVAFATFLVVLLLINITERIARRG